MEERNYGGACPSWIVKPQKRRKKKKKTLLVPARN